MSGWSYYVVAIVRSSPPLQTRKSGACLRRSLHTAINSIHPVSILQLYSYSGKVRRHCIVRYAPMHGHRVLHSCPCTCLPRCPYWWQRSLGSLTISLIFIGGTSYQYLSLLLFRSWWFIMLNGDSRANPTQTSFRRSSQSRYVSMLVSTMRLIASSGPLSPTLHMAFLLADFHY